MAENTDKEASSASNRPLSPHLTIYRPQISSVLSISHRASGVFLAAGAAVFVFFLWCAAYCPDGSGSLHGFFTSFIGKTLLFAWTFAFYFHFANGIRHLLWDMGKGFEIAQVNRSGVIAIIGAIFLTIWTWYLF